MLELIPGSTESKAGGYPGWEAGLPQDASVPFKLLAVNLLFAYGDLSCTCLINL